MFQKHNMTTLIGMVSDRKEPVVVLGSDLSGTSYSWKSEGDMAYRKQERDESQKIYADDKGEVVISTTGLIDGHYQKFLLDILRGKIDVRKAVESGSFKEALDMHLNRLGGFMPDQNRQNSFLIATRFDDKPKLHTCYPLGKVEERYWTSIGSGSEYSLDHIRKSGKMDGGAYLDEAIDLVVGGLHAASLDIYTSGLDLVVIKPNGINQFGDKIRISLEEAKRNTIESIKKEFQTSK